MLCNLSAGTNILLLLLMPSTLFFYCVWNRLFALLKDIFFIINCMRNMASIIASHNKKILRPNIQDYGCNCRKKNECPMQNKCLTPNIICEATITNNNNKVEKIYFGLCKTSFKESYLNHTTSFRLQSYSKDTKFSKYAWKLKNENKIPFIK